MKEFICCATHETSKKENDKADGCFHSRERKKTPSPSYAPSSSPRLTSTDTCHRSPSPPTPNPLATLSHHATAEERGGGVERDVSHNLNLKCQHGSVLHHQSLSWNHVPHPSRSPPGCQRLSYDAIMSTVRIYAMNVPGLPEEDRKGHLA